MLRSHTCGELTLKNQNESVQLCGWVHRVRELGAMTFVDLRDRYGITQLAFNDDHNSDLNKQAQALGREFVLQIKGEVRERSSKNREMETGEIEIQVESLNILNKSETPPFTMEDETDGGEELRMKYRYLDLRRPLMNNRLQLRARAMKSVRDYLSKHNFLEIETPNLIKSTPEGARDFLVPSRLQPGSFYALPQSPQILKQLLMVGGFDRYFQIVKCYRDEDFRGDRQPEFSQVDAEMSFVEQEDVLNMFEGMCVQVFKEVIDVELPAFPRITYKEALKKYGSDKPDLRFDCPIHDLVEIPSSDFKLFNEARQKNQTIAALKATGCAAYSRKQIDQLTEFVKVEHRGLGGLIYIKYNEDGSWKSSIDKFFDEQQLETLTRPLEMEKGDMALIGIDSEDKLRKSLGDLRLELAKRESWIEQGSWSVLWVVDFPLFEKDPDSGEAIFVHHPFCAPRPEDVVLIDSDPLKVRAQTYDLIMNGNEIVSGSIRIHQKDLQDKVFDLLGFSETEKQEQFGFLLDAFRYGAPPHGGCAFGFDRWVMLMCEAETIRDVIAFPKNNSGRDLMMNAPMPVSEEQKKELGLSVDEA